MKREFATVMAALALTLASAAEQSGIAEMHRQWLDAAMERYITYEGWAFGAQPNGWFAAVAGKYAQTNQLPFDGVVLLVQEKLEKEYDAFRNGAPPPDDGTGEDRKARVDMSVNMLRSLGRKPLSLSFLYRMSRKAEGYYRKVFEDMFYETVEKSPVAAIREVLDTHEKLAADANRLARALMNHVFEPKYTTDELLRKMMPRIMEGLRNGEKYFQVDPEMMDRDPGERYAVDELLLTILPSIRDGETALRVDRNLCFRYPEYRTSVQRLVVCAFIEQCEPPVDWDEESRKPALAQKAELAELAATPPEKRTDMRQRFKNLPAPAAAQKEE